MGSVHRSMAYRVGHELVKRDKTITGKSLVKSPYQGALAIA